MVIFFRILKINPQGLSKMFKFSPKMQNFINLFTCAFMDKIPLYIPDPAEGTPLQAFDNNIMDHRVFQFATRGQCIKGKQC